MKIRSEQINTTVGDISGNLALILESVKRAKKKGIDLLVLQELVICGYPAMDLLERRDFIERCEIAADEIRKASKGIAVIFGVPVKNKSGVGRPVYNAAHLVVDGELQSVTHKTLLPTYDVFDELRYFEPNTEFETIDLQGVTLGITICEDIWRNENEINYHTYDIDPAEELAKKGAELLINISASPYSRNKPELRAQMLKGHAKRLSLPIIYSNQVGANTEIIFDGDTMAVNKSGEISARLPLFEEGFVDCRFDKVQKDIVSDANQIQPETCQEERFFKALRLGLSDYMAKSKLGNKVTLGLSGGIDSALTAVIAVETFGAENVFAVTMPSEFSSEGSVTDSERLAENLGFRLEEIPIKNIFDSFSDSLAPIFEGTSFGVAEENLQSRTRGVLLMGISNKFGHVLLNTGNKSEMAVGYCTLYGDMSGGLSVLSDVYKTEVFALSRWLNKEYYKREVIPENIITKPPSAELRPDQKDTDSLPEYELLDYILKSYIEEQKVPADIISEGYDADLVKKITSMVDRNEYKRNQAPPGLRVSPKSFGIGRRLPIVQDWTKQQ